MNRQLAVLLALTSIVFTAACGSKQTPPVARPQPPAAAGNALPPTPPPPPEPVSEPVPVPPVPPADDLSTKDLDDINRAALLKPVFFELDSSDVSGEGQKALQTNAQVMKKYGSWQVTIEGHCDERGTPEYNLALGERRALAARTYLVSLGIPADRIKVISYGKEFPFVASHDESAWSQNRRAHFVVTAK
jgi:peptidoglycan-associated lipoprotein